MSYELVRYQPEYKSVIGALLTEFWPDPATALGQFSWVFEECPYTEEPHFYLLISEGEVAAMRGFYDANWEIAGTDQTFLAPVATMFVTKKQFRGKGLANMVMKGALEDLKSRGYQYVFSTGARPIPQMSQLRRGWRHAGAYHTIKREKKVGVKRARQNLGNRFPFLRTLWRSTRQKVPHLEPNPFSSLDTIAPTAFDEGTLKVTRKPDAAAMAKMARLFATPGLIRHVRDPAYFAWRFNNPRMDYRFVFWQKSDESGFMVLERTLGINTSVVRIIDWEATNSNVLKRLFHSVIYLGQIAPLSVWSAGLSEEIADYLHHEEFAPVDETREVENYRPGVLIKSLDDGPPDAPWEVFGHRIDDFSSWDIRPSLTT